MELVIDVYVGRIGKSRSSLRFTFDGNRIRNDDTPGSLGIEDGTIVEVLDTVTVDNAFGNDVTVSGPLLEPDQLGITLRDGDLTLSFYVYRITRI